MYNFVQHVQSLILLDLLLSNSNFLLCHVLFQDYPVSVHI